MAKNLCGYNHHVTLERWRKLDRAQERGWLLKVLSLVLMAGDEMFAGLCFLRQHSFEPLRPCLKISKTKLQTNITNKKKVYHQPFPNQINRIHSNQPSLSSRVEPNVTRTRQPGCPEPFQFSSRPMSPLFSGLVWGGQKIHSLWGTSWTGSWPEFQSIAPQVKANAITVGPHPLKL